MASPPPIYHYRIYCITESSWVDFYGSTPPTTCPHNTNHTVNPNSAQLLELVGPTIATVQDASPTNAYYQASSIAISIPVINSAPAEVVVNKSFPFDMYLWGISVAPPSSSIGDLFNVQLAPGTVIGATTAPVNSGTNVISVSPTVFELVVKGSEIGITDGKQTEYPGVVTAYDPNAGTITVQNNLANSYAADAQILYSVYAIRDLILDSTERIALGQKGLKAKLLPANTPIALIYTANSVRNTATNVYFQLEYYYS